MADALAWREASRRFGDDPNAECACGHVLISHMPPVYECRGAVLDAWEPRLCECEQFTPAKRCGHGLVRPSGTIYCDRPPAHEGAHEAIGIGSWAKLPGDRAAF